MSKKQLKKSVWDKSCIELVLLNHNKNADSIRVVKEKPICSMRVKTT